MIVTEKEIKQLLTHFEPAILKRGFRYFLNHNVTEFQVLKPGLIQAEVEGSESYQVLIHLENFRFSSCDCPYGGTCKHMAAVIYRTGQEFGLSIESMMDQRTPNSLAQSTVRAVPKEKEKITIPQESGTVEDWHSYFEKRMSQFHTLRFYDIQSLYENAKDEFMPHARSWNPLLQKLYKLHVYLSILKKIDSLYNRTEYSHYYDYQFMDLLQKQSYLCLKEMVEIVRGFHFEDSWNLYASHLQSTITYLGLNAFTETSTFQNWIFVYRLLWSNLLYQKSSIETEQKRLELEQLRSDLTYQQKNYLVLALCHFLIMKKEDEQAMNLAEDRLQMGEANYFYGYLQNFLADQEWDRLLIWLRWLKQLVPDASEESLTDYLNFWEALLPHLDVQEEWRHEIVSLLPRSYWYYSDFLLANQKYQEWVDLNIISGKSPLDLKSADLKSIEAESPFLLLPLYHLYVERYVLEKNRSSYKMSVKLLKKIHQYYKKQQETDRWSTYIQYISKKYSRYRAFQEELRKGKLLG